MSIFSSHIGGESGTCGAVLQHFRWEMGTGGNKSWVLEAAVMLCFHSCLVSCRPGQIWGNYGAEMLWQPASIITSPGFAHHWGPGFWERQKQERQNESMPGHTSTESGQFSHLTALKFGKLLFKPTCPFQSFSDAIRVSNWGELGPFPLCPHILSFSLLNHHPFSWGVWRGAVMATSVVSFGFWICWKLQSRSGECDYISPSFLNPSYNIEERQGDWGRKM